MVPARWYRGETHTLAVGPARPRRGLCRTTTSPPVLPPSLLDPCLLHGVSGGAACLVTIAVLPPGGARGWDFLPNVCLLLTPQANALAPHSLRARRAHTVVFWDMLAFFWCFSCGAHRRMVCGSYLTKTAGGASRPSPSCGVVTAVSTPVTAAASRQPRSRLADRPDKPPPAWLLDDTRGFIAPPFLFSLFFFFSSDYYSYSGLLQLYGDLQTGRWAGSPRATPAVSVLDTSKRALAECAIVFGTLALAAPFPRPSRRGSWDGMYEHAAAVERRV